MDKKQNKNGDGKFIVGILLEFGGEKIRDYCRERIASGMDPFVIFSELQDGLEEIGVGYEDRAARRYFNSDLIVSGRNMKRAIEVLKTISSCSRWKRRHRGPRHRCRGCP